MKQRIKADDQIKGWEDKEAKNKAAKEKTN